MVVSAHRPLQGPCHAGPHEFQAFLVRDIPTPDRARHGAAGQTRSAQALSADALSAPFISADGSVCRRSGRTASAAYLLGPLARTVCSSQRRHVRGAAANLPPLSSLGVAWPTSARWVGASISLD